MDYLVVKMSKPTTVRRAWNMTCDNEKRASDTLQIKRSINCLTPFSCGLSFEVECLETLISCGLIREMQSKLVAANRSDTGHTFKLVNSDIF